MSLKICVLGWPVAHSRSPLIHNHWFRTLGIDGVYDAVALSPDADFKTEILTLKEAGYIGANVTIPHKETAFACADDVDHKAASMGAVNTLYFAPDRIIGRNTDGDGFMAGLCDAIGRVPDFGTMCAVVLGAGGAARAIIGALAGAGLGALVLCNRTRAKADALMESMGETETQIRVVDWQHRDAVLRDADMLVNATSLGMAKGAARLDLSLDALSSGYPKIVVDIVYTPLETPLLAQARAAGHICVDGLAMLLHQAAPSFALWTGRTPQVTPELRALIIRDLEEK